MMEIRITSVPAGGAPEHIRKQWVDVVLLVMLELPTEEAGLVIEDIDATTHKLMTTDDPNLTGYVVKKRDAINALQAAGRVGAADYWRKTLRSDIDVLIFGRQFCEVVEE